MTTNKNITHVVGLAIFIVALILSIRVIWQQYCSTCDSLQWMGPVAQNSTNGIFALPMMGGFQSYSEVYGLHWFLYPLFRSSVINLIPWSTWTEVGIQTILWVAALIVAASVFYKKHPLVFWLLLALGLLAPLYIKSQRLGRIEPAVAFCVVMHFTWLKSYLSQKSNYPRYVIPFCLAAIICMHPIGIPVACVSLLLCLVGASDKNQRINAALTLVAGIAIGGIGFLSYYALNEGAWQQLRENIAAQSLTKSLDTFVKTWMRGEAISMVPFFAISSVTGLIFLIYKTLGKATHLESGLEYGLVVLSAMAFNLVTLNPNFNYMVCFIPWALAGAGHIWCSAVASRSWNMFRFVGVGTLMLFVCYFALISFRSRTMRGGEEFKQTVFHEARSLSQENTILLPLSLWEVAMSDNKNVVFNSFPNVSQPRTNVEYEKHVLDHIQPGSVLILGADMVGRFRESDKTVFGLSDQRYPGGDSSLNWKLVKSLRSDPKEDFYELEFFLYRLE
jgi:hypothetical protein